MAHEPASSPSPVGPAHETDLAAEYSVITVLRRSQIDPGDPIELRIYLTGSGMPGRNKLHMNHDLEEVVDAENPGKLFFNLGISSDSGEVGKIDPPAEQSLDPRGGTTYIPPPIFAQGETPVEHALQWKLLEGTREGDPFLIASLNTISDATPGDYTLPVIFTYESDGTPTQSRSESELHVNNWREQKEPWVTRGAVLAIVIALFSFIVQVVSSVGYLSG